MGNIEITVRIQLANTEWRYFKIIKIFKTELCKAKISADFGMHESDRCCGQFLH